MNEYMKGRIDAAYKLASTNKEFLVFVKKVTGLNNPKNEPYVVTLLKEKSNQNDSK